VESETCYPCALQLAQEFLRQCETIRIDDGFQSILGDKSDHFRDVRMHEWITASNGNTIGFPQPFENPKLLFDLLKGLVAATNVVSIAPIAGQITLSSRFQPRYCVVRQCPRQTIEISVIKLLRTCPMELLGLWVDQYVTLHGGCAPFQ
jgi:hypothetical protein